MRCLQSAQALKEERDELAQRLEQVSLEQTMGAALAETQARCGGLPGPPLRVPLPAPPRRAMPAGAAGVLC